MDLEKKREITNKLNSLYTDFLMLKDGSWQPDDDSISDSINMLEDISIIMNFSLRDNRRPLIQDVEDFVVDGVDSRDFPEFTDAYFSSAIYKDTGEKLTDEELEQLGEDYPEVLNELAYQSLIN